MLVFSKSVSIFITEQLNRLLSFVVYSWIQEASRAEVTRGKGWDNGVEKGLSNDDTWES